MVKIDDCCQTCGQVTDSLYQCPQCKIISYCSKNCERKHKEEHSKVCFAPQTTPNQTNPLAESEVTCSNKKKKSNNKKTDNRKECLKDSSNGETGNFCQTCFRTDVSLQKCPKCKTTCYCSVACQKYDWPTHKSNCKAPEMNTDTKYEKESGHEHSKVGGNKEDPENENCVSVDEGNGREVDSKVGNKNKKKRNRSKKHKSVNSVNMENDGATAKADVRNEIDRKDKGTKANKGNTRNKNHKGKDGGIDSGKGASKEEESQKKTAKVKSKEDNKTGTIKTENKSDARTTVGNNAEKCENCGKNDKHLMTCVKCKNAKYCSKSCQKSAWLLHKKFCNSSKKANDPDLTNKAEKCENCGKLDEPLLKCARCKNAKYCSKSCQEFAWPLHKKSCNSKKANDSDLTSRDYLVRSLLKATVLFPSYEIMANLFAVEEEIQRQKGQGNILVVAKIFKELHNHFRKTYVIIDINGNMAFVEFYIKELDPHPYFSWDQLKPGNYICILKPIIYPGYRYIIDSAEKFHVIEK